MPKVNGKKFGYGSKGMKAAKAYAKKTGKKVSMGGASMGGNGKRIAGARAQAQAKRSARAAGARAKVRAMAARKKRG